MADWRVDVLNGLGAPVTKQNLALLTSWQRWEGGATNNDASFNYLNTTLNAPGATRSINSVGVKAFDSYQHGIGATVQTLLNGRYGGLVQGLRSGNPTGQGVAEGLSTWLSGSPNSAAGVRYAQRVMGAPGSPPPAGQSGLPKGKDAIRQAASESFYSGPAGIAYGPNPSQFRALAGAALLQASQRTAAGDLSGGTDALFQIAALRKQYNAAAYAATQAAASAAQDGGQVEVNVPQHTLDPSTPPKLADAIAIAEQQIGKPYVWGAESPAEGGFDCSGLIDYAFKRAGIPIPGRLTTQTALKLGKSVKGQPMRPGDWLITNGGEHMVMYVGNGRVIAAPHTGTVVQYQPVSRFDGDIVDVRRLG